MSAENGHNLIEHSEHLNELAGALAQAQAEIENALRESDNPFFKSKYASLGSTWEACRPALTSHGLSVTQWPFTDEHAVGVTTMLLHASGQWLRGRVSAVPKDLSPQSVGSTVSYLKRYSLAAVAGVATEDDDAETAQARPAPTRAQEPRGAPVVDDVPFAYQPPGETPEDPRPAFREGSKRCPYCRKDTVIKGKPEYGGGWVCYAKKGGCGEKWPEGAKVVDKTTGEVKSEDNKPFLVGAIVRLATEHKLTAPERKALADKFLKGEPAHECQDEGALGQLYLFLGDREGVNQWRTELAR